MSGFRRDDQQPPGSQPVTDGVVMRVEGVYEVDPALMQQHVHQQDMPIWDTMRIVRSRHDHLLWMHDHFADDRLSGEQILKELRGE